jgi:ElaB/YqjD/DUF883 family membrane-anchored ribosome-binding protein
MNIEKRTYETPTPQSGKETGSDTSTGRIMDRGAEAYGKAEKAVSDAYDKTSEKVGQAYDKTSEKVSETYEKAKDYSSENPGKTILIALGIGVGLGLLLGAGSTRRSTGNRFVQPVVHALSDIASQYFR